jgi:hypothetical protein
LPCLSIQGRVQSSPIRFKKKRIIGTLTSSAQSLVRVALMVKKSQVIRIRVMALGK